MNSIFKQALAPWTPPPTDYEARVQALEAEGLTRSDAQGVIDAQDMTPAPGVGEYVFEFDHPNGDVLTCHLEYDAGDPSEPERMTLVNAYLGAVDVHGLLPIPIIDQIEAEALGHSWP